MKKCWQNEYEYKRILEILADYWLTEPEEEYVSVNMYFRHTDGQEQWKSIHWINPNRQPKVTNETPKLKWRSFADIEAKCRSCLYGSAPGGCRTWDCEYVDLKEYIEQRSKEEAHGKSI